MPIVIGREDEIDKIKDIFLSSNYAVLSGLGGIGKTYTALLYAYHLQKSGGWITQCVTCENADSLQEAVARLQFHGLEYDKNDLQFDIRLKALQAHSKPIIIIFDDFNLRFEQDDLKDLKKLTECTHARFIFTSRQKPLINNRHIVKIKPMNTNSLLELYWHYRFDEDHPNKYDYINKHKEILTKMFDLIGGHTLMIELLAKLPIRSGLSECEIYNYLNNNLDVSSSETGIAKNDTLSISSAKVGVVKDDIYIDDNVNEIIKKIFAVSKLNNVEKDIMTHMSLISTDGIKQSLFEELTGYSPDELNSLKESNWIMMDERKLKLRLHPLIAEAALNIDETRPS